MFRVELEGESLNKADLFVASVGFEDRARFVGETQGLAIADRFAATFGSRQVLSFDKNYRWFSKNGFRVETVEEENYGCWCTDILDAACAKKAPDESLHVAIDISSMTRFRIATWVRELGRTGNDRPIQASFLYSIARFSRPYTESEPNVFLGPIIPKLAGWPSEPERPVVAVIGIGYEQNKAVGVVEHVQASDVWILRPKSGEREYEKYLEKANALLTGLIRPGRSMTYLVHRPLESFIRLESLAASLSRTSSVVLVPLGPKIFSLLAILVGFENRQVGVWRVSGGEFERPIQRYANGTVIRLDVGFKIVSDSFA